MEPHASIYIDNPQTEELARKLARMLGVTLEEAVRHAVKRELEFMGKTGEADEPTVSKF